jgi:hypothetical protein
MALGGGPRVASDHGPRRAFLRPGRARGAVLARKRAPIRPEQGPSLPTLAPRRSALAAGADLGALASPSAPPPWRSACGSVGRPARLGPSHGSLATGEERRAACSAQSARTVSVTCVLKTVISMRS